MMRKLCILLCLLLCLSVQLCACGKDTPERPRPSKTEPEPEAETLPETSAPTEPTKIQEATEPSTEPTSESTEATTAVETTVQTTQGHFEEPSPWDTYEQFVDGLSDVVEFAFFDLNSDGRTELIVKTGTCEADYQYTFYTYDNTGIYYIGLAAGGHSYLASDGTHLIIAGGQMGLEWAFEVTYYDALMLTELFRREIGTGEYTKFPVTVDIYYPETSKPETCPVSVKFVDVSTLAGINYTEFTTEASDFLGQVLFTANPAVTNFCVYTLNVDDMVNYGEAVMDVSELLFSMDVLSEESPLLLNITFYDIFPHHGVSFDILGETHYYYLTTSGMDGSLIFEEFYP